MIENIFLSLESIWAHKLRSVLTMIGVIIGIGAIVAIFSIVEGNTEQTKKTMIGSYNNSLTLKYDTKKNLNGDFGGETEEKADYLMPLSTDQIKKINEVEGVKNSTITYEEKTEVKYKDSESSGKVLGVIPNYFDYYGYELVKGRLFNKTDYTLAEQIALLDESLYKSLFPEENGVGQLIEVNGLAYRVVGIVKKEEAQNGTVDYNDPDGKVFVSYLNWPKFLSSIDPVPQVTIQTEKADDLQPVAQKVADYLNTIIPQSGYIFGIQNSKEIEQKIDEYASTQFQLLGGIASISLIVGGIGVMNIMLVSVTERTREIGIKKALGARREVILTQFLLESIVLTVIGGILGILLGLAGGKIATMLLGYSYFVSVLSIVGSLVFSIIIGLVFGLLPALKASKLDPIEALRYE